MVRLDADGIIMTLRRRREGGRRRSGDGGGAGGQIERRGLTKRLLILRTLHWLGLHMYVVGGGDLSSISIGPRVVLDSDILLLHAASTPTLPTGNATALHNNVTLI